MKNLDKSKIMSTDDDDNDVRFGLYDETVNHMLSFLTQVAVISVRSILNHSNVSSILVPLRQL